MVRLVIDKNKDFIESCRTRYRDRAAGLIDKNRIRELVRKDRPPHDLCEIYLYCVTLRHNEVKKNVYTNRSTIIQETNIGYDRVVYVLRKLEGLKIFHKTDNKRYEILWEGIDIQAAREAKKKLDGEKEC